MPKRLTTAIKANNTKKVSIPLLWRVICVSESLLLKTEVFNPVVLLTTTTFVFSGALVEAVGSKEVEASMLSTKFESSLVDIGKAVVLIVEITVSTKSSEADVTAVEGVGSVCDVMSKPAVIEDTGREQKIHLVKNVCVCLQSCQDF